MRLNKQQLRLMILSEIRAISEGKCDKASGGSGCVREREKGWVIISNETGKALKKGKNIVYYKTEADAEAVLSVPGMHG